MSTLQDKSLHALQQQVAQIYRLSQRPRNRKACRASQGRGLAALLQLQCIRGEEGRLQSHDLQMSGGILHSVRLKVEDVRVSLVQLYSSTGSGSLE